MCILTHRAPAFRDVGCREQSSEGDTRGRHLVEDACDGGK